MNTLLENKWFDIQGIAQILGLIAFLIGAAAFFQRGDKRLRFFLTVNSGLLTLHFFLLGATGAAINCLLSAIRTWLSNYSRSLWLMFFFILLLWVLVIPELNYPMQWLTLVGSTLGTYGFFRLQGIALRLCMLIGTICWLTHNIWAGSIGGTLQESFFLLVNCRTLFILYREKREAIKKETENLNSIQLPTKSVE